MPLGINTPLHGKLTLSDKTLEAMLKGIDDSYKYGIEYGVPFCQIDEVIDPDSTCEGDECSVGVARCPEGTEKVGDFHSHVNTLDQKGYAVFSPADHLMSLLGESKLDCVWGQQDNKVMCESIAREATPGEKMALADRFDQLQDIMQKVAMGVPISLDDRTELIKLAHQLDDHFTEVATTDRAGLAEAKAKVSSLEQSLTYYSHKELTERARKAGISTEGGKRHIAERLIAAGVI